MGIAAARQKWAIIDMEMKIRKTQVRGERERGVVHHAGNAVVGIGHCMYEYRVSYLW